MALEIMPKMRIYITILLALSIVTSSIVNIYLYKSRERTSMERAYALEDYNNLANLYIKQSRHSNIECPLDVGVIDINGQKKGIEELFALYDSLIVFRYNANSCLPCVEKEIQLINELVESGKLKNIVLLCSIVEFNDFISFCRVNQFRGQCFNVETGRFVNYYEDNGLPYYMIFSKGILTHVFAPYSKDDKITRLYFSELANIE